MEAPPMTPFEGIVLTLLFLALLALLSVPASEGSDDEPKFD